MIIVTTTLYVCILAISGVVYRILPAPKGFPWNQAILALIMILITTYLTGLLAAFMWLSYDIGLGNAVYSVLIR